MMFLTDGPSRTSGVRRAPSMRASYTGKKENSSSSWVLVKFTCKVMFLENHSTLALQILGPANTPNNAGQAGAVDAELFLQAFDDVKPISFHNVRTLQVEIDTISKTLNYLALFGQIQILTRTPH